MVIWTPWWRQGDEATWSNIPETPRVVTDSIGGCSEFSAKPDGDTTGFGQSWKLCDARPHPHAEPPGQSGAKATARQTLARPPGIVRLRGASGVRRVHHRFLCVLDRPAWPVHGRGTASNGARSFAVRSICRQPLIARRDEITNGTIASADVSAGQDSPSPEGEGRGEGEPQIHLDLPSAAVRPSAVPNPAKSRGDEARFSNIPETTHVVSYSPAQRYGRTDIQPPGALPGGQRCAQPC